MEFFRRLPDWRVSLVWRLYGWAGVQQLLILSGNRSWPDFFDRSPWVMHALCACSLLLILVGPVPLLVVATAITTVGLLWITASGTSIALNFPGAELPLFAAMPAGTVVLWALARARGADDRELGRSLLALYQLAFVVEMGFATLHKVNRDFLDAELSCAGALNEMLPQWWDTPLAALARFLEPPVVLGFEAALPILSILYWPLGLLVTFLFFVGLAMIGPTGFTAVSISAAFGFVRGTSARDFFALPRRWPLVFVFGAIGVAGYVAWAHRAPPSYPWEQFALYAVVAAFFGVCLLNEIARDLRGRRAGGLWAAVGLAWPQTAVQRSALLLILVVGVLNGLTPYFGYKYHFSFSMLSNLRTDTLRWNSYVVPEWFRLVEPGPFVEVRHIEIEREGGRPSPPERELFEAHWPPYEFVHRVKYHAWLGHELHVVVVYEGEEHVFANVRSNPDAQAFLAGLPRALLWQKVLVDGRQPCTH